MKILVIDDEQSFATLLGRALRRLGHASVIALDPRDALELLPDGFDAVITDIDMPAMDGVTLARTIREQHGDLPVAFCTGSSPGGRAVAEAKTLGRVLPKSWTVEDVRDLVGDLAEERDRLKRVPRASYPRIPDSLLPRPALAGRALTPRPETSGAPRPRLRKVRLDVCDWRRVEDLCSTSLQGPVFITVGSPGDACPGDSMAVSVNLPDEITVSIAGEVQAVRPNPGSDGAELIIELTGLTPDLAARLSSLASPSKDALASPYFGERGALDWSPAATRRAPSDSDGENDGSCRGRPLRRRLNGREELRSQIEVLGRRLRRKS